MAYRPDQSVFQTPLFWWALLSPIVVGLVFGAIILINTPFESDWSANGFNYFLEIMKFPLGIMALSIPLVALVLANYRSIQTAAQIAAQMSQNNFSNYFKHIEEFEKALIPFFNGNLINGSVNSRALHTSVFRDARVGVVAPSQGFEADLDSQMVGIKEELLIELDYYKVDKFVLTERHKKLVTYFTKTTTLLGYSHTNHSKLRDINFSIDLVGLFYNQMTISLINMQRILIAVYDFSSVQLTDEVMTAFSDIQQLLATLKTKEHSRLELNRMHGFVKAWKDNQSSSLKEQVLQNVKSEYLAMDGLERFLLANSTFASRSEIERLFTTDEVTDQNG